MYVLEVIPLSRSAPPGTLSYRSHSKLAAGTLVSVSLRTQTVPAMVIDCMTVAEAKAVLKTASFALSKSAKPIGSALPRPLFEAAERLAAFHAAPVGSVLTTLLSDSMLTGLPKLAMGERFKRHAIEGGYKKRLNAYRTRIRTNHEAKLATLLIVPTIAEADMYKHALAEFDPHILAGTIPAKKREDVLQSAIETKGLVIATPGYAWLPIKKLGTIIAERISAGTYTAPKRPYLDMRLAAEEAARARSIPFIAGDYPLPLEYRTDPEAALGGSPSHDIQIVDTRSDREREGAWQAIPDILQKQLRAASSEGKRSVLLAVRKGYAPTVVCRDCGTAVTDARGRALSLAKVKGENVFRSADGTELASVKTVCERCGSWNLYPLGVGVERVYEEAKRLFSDVPVIHFDAVTAAQAKKLLKQTKEPGCIVIGTEFMLPWLSPDQGFDLAAIVSADSLLALPFWRARERFVRIGLLLSERAHEVVVCTRRPEDTAVCVLSHATKNTFFKEETSLRRALGYPPFGHLLHFSTEAPKERIEHAMRLIRERAGESVSFLPLQSAPGRMLRLAAILHVPEWPDPSRSVRLQSLPPWIRIRIDTETLW